MKKRYKVSAWTVTPCPYLTENISSMDCEKLCDTISPSVEKGSPCVFKAHHETKFYLLFLFWKTVDAIFYDYMNTETIHS